VILVMGATGNVAREVVSQLVAAGVATRAMTHRADFADLPIGIDCVPGDLSNPESLAAALDGADAVFLVWPIGEARGAEAAVGAIARRARRIVYLSTAAVRDDLEQQTHPLSAMHAFIEGLIARAGVEWTVLRASKFATNTRVWAPQIRATGAVELPYAAAARSPIHQRDIAAVAVRAVTEDTHAGATYLVTGPASLTECEQVHIIGEALGRTLVCRDIPPDVARQEMLAEGSSPELADAALAYWARLVTDGEPVTPTVQELTGTPARTFLEWAVEHVADFGGASKPRSPAHE
jgi:uncharacterized protein YbjT (DUF2867 family)